MFSYKTEYSCHRLGMSLNHLETGLNKITVFFFFKENLAALQEHKRSMNTKNVLLTLELIRRKILAKLTKGLSVLEGGGP